MEETNKFYMEGKIILQAETPELKERAAKSIELPPENERQPDLLYMSAILVSSGENLNNAYFLPSELIAAENSISFKALDIEHSETDIVGSILSREYIDSDGNKLNLTELSSKETAALNEMNMHIAISAVVYKNRFPNVAKEIADGTWSKVSMECYYQNYDIKIGEVIMSKREAEAIGLAASNDSVFGRMARIIKDGKELAAGNIARVLRGICFSGCGIVKNPANPPSVILEVAKENVNNDKSLEEDIILSYDTINKEESSTLEELDNNNVTLEDVEDVKSEIAVDTDDFGNICSYYKHKVFDKDNNLIKERWCAAYEQGCTSFSRGLQDPDCLRNKDIQKMVIARYNKLRESSAKKDKRERLLKGLKAALCEAVKTRSR